VIFSDKSIFGINRAASTRVRRLTGRNKSASRFTVKTIKHSPGFMIWGCFTEAPGRESLYVLPKGTTMNGERYKEVMEAKLLPFMQIHPATHFLQDGTPCHTSK
jgi:hypothetical protein